MKSKIVILSLVCAAVFAAGLFFFHYIPDDTYITLRYARNILHGIGFVYNSGERVEGYTNFLWLLIIVFAGKIGLPLAFAARGLSFLFSMGTLALLPFAASKPDGGSKREGWYAAFTLILPALLLAASPPFSTWSLSGTEIPLFTFLLLWAYILVRSGERPCAAFIVFALLGLVRPEGALFYILAWMSLLARSNRKALVLAQGLAIATFFYAPYLIWKWRYFHALLPNTFYAKTGSFDLMTDNGARYVLGFILCHGYLFFIGYFLMGRSGDRAPAAIIALFVAAHWIAIILLGGDWMPNYRLLLPTMPLIMLAISQGLTSAGNAAHRSTAVLVGLMFLVATVAPGAITYDSFTLERVSVGAFERLGERLREILPPGTSIGCGSTGAIGYYTELPMIDILGLTDSAIARHGQIVGTQPGHLKTDGAYVLKRKPDLLLLGNIQIHQGTRDESAMKTKVQEKEITRQPDFSRDYEYVNIPLGDGFYLSCYKLKTFFLPL